MYQRNLVWTRCPPGVLGHRLAEPRSAPARKGRVASERSGAEYRSACQVRPGRCTSSRQEEVSLPVSRVASLPSDSGGPSPLLSNPKSFSSQILAAVAATAGGDGGAYPSVTVVGRRGVSRPRLMGASGHRRRALGGAAILGWGLSASTGSTTRREWCAADMVVPRPPRSDLGLGPRSRSGGPRQVRSWCWSLPRRRAALVCPLHVFRSGW
jgi:hypothetical protein